MGTLKDQAVLQAIFNPNTPFGDEKLDLGEEAEKEDDDEGECLTLASSPPHWLVCRPPWGGRGRSYKVPCLSHDPWLMVEIRIRAWLTLSALRRGWQESLPRAKSRGLSQSFSPHTSEPHSRLNFSAIPLGVRGAMASAQGTEDGKGAGLSRPTHVTHVTHRHWQSPELTTLPLRGHTRGLSPGP